MTKAKKIIVGALITVASLLSLGTYAADGIENHRGTYAANGIGNDRGAFIANKLDLNEDQKAKFDNLQKVISEQKEANQADNMREQFKALLTAPVLDQYQALTLFEQKAATMQQSAPIIIAAIASFTDSLSAEQKAKAQDMMEMMQKFGRQGGGKFGSFPFK